MAGNIPSDVLRSCLKRNNKRWERASFVWQLLNDICEHELGRMPLLEIRAARRWLEDDVRDPLQELAQWMHDLQDECLRRVEFSVDEVIDLTERLPVLHDRFVQLERCSLQIMNGNPNRERWQQWQRAFDDARVIMLEVQAINNAPGYIPNSRPDLRMKVQSYSIAPLKSLQATVTATMSAAPIFLGRIERTLILAEGLVGRL